MSPLAVTLADVIDTQSALAQFVIRATSPHAMVAASQYLAAEAVHIREVRDLDVVIEVEVEVAEGDGVYDWYETAVLEISTVVPGGGGIDAACTCARQKCSHVAAALLVSPHLLGMEQTAITPVPAWQRTLDDVLPPVPETSSWQEICLFLKVEDSSRNGGSGRLTIRPGVRGNRGNWIKGKASWSGLHRIWTNPVVEEALDELHDLSLRSSYGAGGFGWYGYRSPDQDWLDLSSLESPRLWETLMTLRRAGVEFLSWDSKRPVAFDDEPLRPRFVVSGSGKTLRLGAELLRGDDVLDSEQLVYIGEPAVAVVRTVGTNTAATDLVLSALDNPAPQKLRKLFSRKNRMRVSAEERETFEQEYLPRLQQMAAVESPDGTYEPPAPPQSTLLVQIEHGRVVDGENRTHLSFSWDRGPLGAADPERETAVLSAVREAAGDQRSLIFSEVGTLQDCSLSGGSAVLFVAEVLPRLEQLDGVRVEENESSPEYRSALEPPKVSVKTDAEDHDWFDLHFAVTVEDHEVEFQELFTALARDEPAFLLPDGTYFRLDTPELDQLRQIIEEARQLNDRPLESLRISKYQVDLWDELVELGIVAAQENAWWEKVRKLAGSAQLQRLDPPETLQAELRDYQQDGYSWLNFLRENHLGGVLADDMGLGKTLQVLAMIEQARLQDPGAAPFLIVAPTSVVGNWGKEAERFTPELGTRIITETQKRRGTTLGEAAEGAHIVVTSYALFRLEFEQYQQVQWSGMILDEAQMIKNHASRGYRCARMLEAPFKLAVTGTPLENNLLELWALASFACPGLLGGREHFIDVFQHPVEKEHDAAKLETLQRRLQPFLLRRSKESVAEELPEKQEQVMELELHPKHRKLYDRRLQRERQKVLGLVDDMKSNRFEIFRSLTLLRQLALDAELADEGEAPSAKLDALGDLLQEVTAEGHKVLVLSQFTRFLSKARAAAENKGITGSYLDGKTKNRQNVIDTFRNGGSPVFFISLKAGGFGLNLTEADYVVLLDPWWNPAVETQAVDRAHRIGQDKNVMVYRMVSENTIESKVMELKESKLQLFDRVLDGGGAAQSTQLSAEDITALLT